MSPYSNDSTVSAFYWFLSKVQFYFMSAYLTKYRLFALQSPEPLMKTPLLPASLTKPRRERPQLKQELLQTTHLTFTKENRDPLLSASRSKSCDVLYSPAADSIPNQAQKRSSPSGTKPAKRTSPGNARSLCTKQVHSPPVSSLIIPTKRPNKEAIARPGKRSPPTAATLARTLQLTSPPDRKQGTESKVRLSPLNGVSGRRSSSSLRKPPTSVEARRSSPRFHTPTPVSVSSLRMNEFGLPCVTNPLSRSTTPQHRRFPCTLTTSTPATRTASACLLTPKVERNSSMSPITRSTQRMPRAMQVNGRRGRPLVVCCVPEFCVL